MVRDVAVIAFAQMPNVRRETVLNEVEMLMPVIEDVRAKAGVTRTTSASPARAPPTTSPAQAFSFVSTLDGVGPWPPIQESHVEMDGAFALYEAWVKLQLGEVDTALVYCYGKSSPGPIHEVLTRQLDPYHVAPLWPDADQPRRPPGAGRCSTPARRPRRTSPRSPPAAGATRSTTRTPSWRGTARSTSTSPRSRSSTRCARRLPADHRRRRAPWSSPPTTGPASAASGPAWIRGIDHRIEPMALGLRDLTDVGVDRASPAEKAGADAAAFDVAELHAPFSHQELILREALGLGDHVDVNPSGGALAANPVMVAGLIRIGEVAQRIMDGTADPRRRPRHVRARACSRTSSPSWKGDG